VCTFNTLATCNFIRRPNSASHMANSDWFDVGYVAIKHIETYKSTDTVCFKTNKGNQ
jgi:hypothetical protein